MDKAFLDGLRDRITNGEIEEALMELDKALKEKNSSYRQETILHLANIRDWKQDNRMGVISAEQSRLTLNRISYGVLELLNELERRSI